MSIPIAVSEPAEFHGRPCAVPFAAQLGPSGLLLMAAVVFSLCGSCMELLQRYHPLPVNPTVVVMPLAFLLMAMRRDASMKRGQKRLLAMLVLLCGWGVLAALFRSSSDMGACFGQVYAILASGALAWCCMWLPARDEILPVMSFYCACGLLLMGLMFTPFVLSGTYPPGPQLGSWHVHAGVARIPWTLDDPNYFSSNLILMNLLCLYAFLNAKYSLSKVVCAAGLASGFLMQVFTMSRAGIISLVFAVVIYSLLVKRKKLAVICVVGLAVGVIASNALLGELISWRFVERIHTDGSLSSRLAQYRVALRLGVDYPLGTGLRQSEAITVSVVYHRIHSTFFELFAELGVVGFAVLSVLVCTLSARWLRIGSSLRRRQAADHEKLYAEWVVLTSICVGVLLVASSVAMVSRTSLWATIGLMAWFGTHRAAQNPIEDDPGCHH